MAAVRERVREHLLSIAPWREDVPWYFSSGQSAVALPLGINFILALIFVWLLPTFDGQACLRDVPFFVLLLTLLVSFHDRYYSTTVRSTTCVARKR
jgi:hypothetical protein